MASERMRYYTTLSAFLLFLALLLLTLVDIRRGFLFTGYFKVGAPATLLNLNMGHLLLLAIGGVGAWLSYRALARLETTSASLRLQTAAKVMALAVGVFMVIDLFIYRGVAASRIAASGKMSAGAGTMGLAWGIPVASFPGWLQPAAEGLNYLLVVWHATILGMLIGGLFLVAGASLMLKLRERSFRSHVAGAAMSLSQPFCSCCAAPVGCSLYRRGAALGPALAFTISSPMLNITSLVLASLLLPAQFALLRIGGGIIVGVFLTYAIALLATRRLTKGTEMASGRSTSRLVRFATAYGRLFQFENLTAPNALSSPAAFVSSWLRLSGRLARVMVPVLLLGAIVVIYIMRAMPESGNSAAGVLVTSFFGTLLMVPTWTEIPFAAQLINNGQPALAASVLIALPAVSIPCLIIIGSAIRSARIAAVLGAGVFAVAVIAGLIFL
ncbi:MAG: permease [Chloroflexi bacterium]|nr:permease [Chloroflexota bacterium]